MTRQTDTIRDTGKAVCRGCYNYLMRYNMKRSPGYKPADSGWLCQKCFKEVWNNDREKYNEFMDNEH